MATFNLSTNIPGDDSDMDFEILNLHAEDNTLIPKARDIAIQFFLDSGLLAGRMDDRYSVETCRKLEDTAIDGRKSQLFIYVSGSFKIGVLIHLNEKNQKQVESWIDRKKKEGVGIVKEQQMSVKTT